MPWKECSVTDERMQFVARRLAGEAMAELCREFGISRKTDSLLHGLGTVAIQHKAVYVEAGHARGKFERLFALPSTRFIQFLTASARVGWR